MNLRRYVVWSETSSTISVHPTMDEAREMLELYLGQFPEEADDSCVFCIDDYNNVLSDEFVNGDQLVAEIEHQQDLDRFAREADLFAGALRAGAILPEDFLVR